MKTNVKLISKETIADGTMAFHFSKPDDFEFRAGQCADFTLIDPPQTDQEGNVRAFSLVQAPYEPDLVVATRMRDPVGAAAGVMALRRESTRSSPRPR